MNKSNDRRENEMIHTSVDYLCEYSRQVAMHLDIKLIPSKILWGVSKH